MQDPLKQGLKPHKVVGFKIRIQIRMQDPLKQGLKHKLRVSTGQTARDSNARSIKTRIETDTAEGLPLGQRYSNARSIKTRIETLIRCIFIFSIFCIRMQDPLKQGLKLDD